MLKMKILNERKEEEYNRKGPMVLKTRLKNVPITDKLRNWKPQSFSELINIPFEQKQNFPTFTMTSFKDTLKKSILSNSIINRTILRAQDHNRTQSDMNIILNMRNRMQTEPNENRLLDMTTIMPSHSHKPRHSQFFEEEEMKILLKENYSSYTLKLKELYPSFKFNHYYKTRSEQIEDYYRKYGEKGDINNRNFSYRAKVMEKNKVNEKEKEKEEKYIQSNLLDIIGVQDNVKISPSEFKIKQDFLSRTDIVEITMIQNDLSFKMGIINKELDSILEKNGNKIYNYTLKNISLKKEIEEYLQSVKNKRLTKAEINKKYISNSTKLIIKGFRKNKISKFLSYLYGLEEIRKEVKQLDLILISDDYFKIRDISNKISDIKARIKKYKETYKIKSRFKIFKNIESKIKSYESKGEERMFNQFTLNMEKLLNNCLLYKSDDFNEIKNSGTVDKTKLEKWNLTKEKETKNNFFFMNEDFELIENHTNKFIKYLLIYNNINTSVICDLLLSILDMVDIIIKDGMDMNIIVNKYKDVLRKIIVDNFDLIEKESNNKLVIIYIISNCYTILLSNYFYIIEVLQKNFGLNIKIFNDVTQVIKEEMDKFVSIVILAYLHEVMFGQEWSKFLNGIKNAKKYCFIYLSNGYTNLNWETMTNDVYKEYMHNFNTTETQKLKDKINALKWEEIKEIEPKYQQMFEVLYTSRSIEVLTPEQIDINLIYKNSPQVNEKNSYIIISSSTDEDDENEENKDTKDTKDDETNNENSKQKISQLSLLYIHYTYQILNIYVSTTNDDLKDDIVNNLFKTTKEILIDTNTLITNNNNNPNNKKISLYCSDLTVMEKSLCAILDLYENEELQLLFSDIRQSCADIIIHSISLINSSIINNFNSLQFDNYPILTDDFNNFVKEFKKIKVVYDEIINCVVKDDLNKIFGTSFDYLFDELNKSINSKGSISNENGVKQFKKDFENIKETLKAFEEVNTEKYLEIIEKLINPTEPHKEKDKNENENEKKDE